MFPFLQIGSLQIPMYGLMIASGIVTANVIAYFVVKKHGLNWWDMIILEGYTLLGGIIGSKLLYFIVSFKEIEWNRITDEKYLNAILASGFVFYGGLILGLAMFFMAGKIHNIDFMQYANKLIFLVPWIHGFGRIGCFMAGCCYGKPYTGFLAVTYPECSLAAPAGVPLFPIQLVEAIFLLVISIVLLIFIFVNKCSYSVELYLAMYGVLRFVLEYMRYDEKRGIYGWFSTSQWISIGIFVVTIGSCIYKSKVKNIKRYKKNSM